MKIPFQFVLFVIFLVLTPITYGQSTGDLSEYAGRYTDGKDYAVYFELTKYGMTIRPVLWTATQLLGRESGDNFVVVDRVSRAAIFSRDAASGKITGVAIRGMDGEGLMLKRADSPLLAIELFMAGRTAEAVRSYAARGDEGLARALVYAQEVLRRYPTGPASVVRFLNELAPHIRPDARYYALLGYAQVAVGNRKYALTAFRTAYSMEKTDERVISGLSMLGALPPDVSQKKEPWKIPFSLASVFVKPTAAEIKAVEDDWAKRDLKPAGIREELRSTVTIAGWTGNVRIVSHLVHGSRHYGAIIIPKNAGPGCCPVIIEAKGVSPTYFPLTLEDLSAPLFMGEFNDRVIYVVPTYRGEVLEFAGRTFTSEGDRRDALDGATDDTIALLNVALETTPEADSKRISAFGRSRGGTVALLAGIRDPRIKCVANWSGPTDWFYSMGTEGWTEQEFWKEGIRIHATPLEIGGQNIERFLGHAIEGKADLADVRQNMIASSPLYFARRLPLSQHHYGLEDTSVPTINGRQLVDVLKRFHRPYTAFFYRDQGHDTDRINAPPTTRDFIVKALGLR